VTRESGSFDFSFILKDRKSDGWMSAALFVFAVRCFHLCVAFATAGFQLQNLSKQEMQPRAGCVPVIDLVFA
jgi:hypothetical protein